MTTVTKLLDVVIIQACRGRAQHTYRPAVGDGRAVKGRLTHGEEYSTSTRLEVYYYYSVVLEAEPTDGIGRRTPSLRCGIGGMILSTVQGTGISYRINKQSEYCEDQVAPARGLPRELKKLLIVQTTPLHNKTIRMSRDPSLSKGWVKIPVLYCCCSADLDSALHDERHPH